MDLRPLIKDANQIAKARELVAKGLIHYQPFIFADDLETGAGYEFVHGEYKGMVYDLTHDRRAFADNDELRRWFIDVRDKELFRVANQRLRDAYDAIIDGIYRNSRYRKSRGPARKQCGYSRNPPLNMSR